MPELQALATGPDLPVDLLHLPHVLLMVDCFPKALGGGERVVLRLAELLPRYGYRVSLLTFARHPESAFRPEEAPCPVYLLPLTKTYGLQSLLGAVTLRRFLLRERIEIVQTFFESSDLWGGLVTRLLSPARLIWSRRDMGILRGRKHHLAYRALRRMPHAVAAVSQRVADHVVGIDGVPEERVHVIHNGFDLAFTQPRPSWSADGRAPSIITIGNIRHVKGHDLLIEAAAKVVAEFPAARFSFAGEVLEPEYFAALLAKLNTLGLAGNVTFLGGVSDLPAYLREGDIFVLPSRSEGFSNALVEAMAAGLPCVATDVGGNAEALEDQVSGLIIPPESSAAIAEALLLLLRSPRLAERISAAARQKAVTDFSSEAMLQKVTSLFAEVRNA